MKPSIEHEVQVGGFVYKILGQEHFDECVDFFFKFFINGNPVEILYQKTVAVGSRK